MMRRKTKHGSAMRYVTLIVLLAAVYFGGSDYLRNLALIIGLYSLPALGLALLWGYTGQISLGHAAFYGLGAYGSALLSLRLELDPWLAMPLAVVLVAGVAWGLGWLVFRLHGHYLAMATLGLGIIVHVGFVELHGLTGGPNGLSAIPALALLGKRLVTETRMLPLVWLLCIVVLLAIDALIRSPRGIAIRTVGESERVAASVGIDVAATKRVIFVLSAVFASVSGALYAHYLGYLSPGPFDVGFSIKLLLIVAIGGFAETWGVLFGVAFVVLLGELLKPLAGYEVIVLGSLLVATMLYCPEGLLQRLLSWRRAAPSMAVGERAS